MKIFYLLMMVMLVTSPFWGVLPKQANRYFSPNLDGVKDKLSIPLNIKDDGYLVKWKLILSKKEGEVFTPIRTFESVNALEIQNLNVLKFLNRIFQKKEKIVIPSTVEWDGLQENWSGSNVTYTKAVDGEYYFKILAIDESGNEASSPQVLVVLDTVTPESQLVLEDNIFSPNGDGRKDTLSLKLKVKNVTTYDEVAFEVLTSSRERKAVWKYTSTAFTNESLEIRWDGKDQTGKDLPEGNYLVRTEAADLAGNRQSSATTPIKLVRTFETLLVKSSTKVFSPNNDGNQDTLLLSQILSSRTGLLAWRTSILQVNGDRTNLMREYSGKKDWSEVLSLDGKNTLGKQIPDGKYFLLVEALFDSGNDLFSDRLDFEIDTKAPEIALTTEYNNFVPLASSEGRKTFKIGQQLKGQPTDLYRAELIDENSNVILSTNYGSNVPNAFEWDGKNNSSEMVAGKYRYVLIGRDLVGNQARSESTPFELIGETATASIAAQQTAFSPGKGNGRDFIGFKLDVNTKKEVTRQTVKILNEKRNMVWMTNANAFFDSTTWSGVDENGKGLPDGKYYYQLELTLSTGENPKVGGRYVILDTTPIQISKWKVPSYFSPNEDGRQDTLGIEFKKEVSEQLNFQDRVTLVIKDLKGQSVRQQSWLAEIPSGYAWDGLDQIGGKVTDGYYTAELTTLDAAGNKNVTSLEKFYLAQKLETLTFETSRQVLSISNADTVVLKPVLSTTNFLQHLSVWAQNASGQKYLLAQKLLSEPFIWTGKDVSNRFLPDNRYRVYAEASYEHGNISKSESKEILLDSVPPDNRIFTAPDFFSPDNDGVDDLLMIGLRASDTFGVTKNELTLFRQTKKDDKGRLIPQTLSNYLTFARPFKVWNLSNGEFKSQLTWDGLSDQKELVESANDYIFFFKSEDLAGNVSIISKPITVDVLVEKLPDGRLRIMINSITFAFDSARLSGDYDKTIDRLVYILAKFPDYKIHIVGHTDSRGQAWRNLELSQQRARSIYQALVDKDILAARLSTSGKGASELLLSPEKVEDNYTTEENYRKNRRVEFFLKKEEPKK